jgi:hypothetical protein
MNRVWLKTAFEEMEAQAEGLDGADPYHAGMYAGRIQCLMQIVRDFYGDDEELQALYRYQIACEQ